MSGVYPQFQPSYNHEELVEHFLLTPVDLQLMLTPCRKINGRQSQATISSSDCYAY